MKTCCFIGHSTILDRGEIGIKLLPIVENLILGGYNNFLMGTHGDFDSISQATCKILKVKYPYINICLILSNLSLLGNSDNSKITMDLFKSVNTKFYDIENVYFKNRITISNQKMIDESDIVVAFVNESYRQSGAGKVLKYAKRKNKNIINLYNC